MNSALIYAGAGAAPLLAAAAAWNGIAAELSTTASSFESVITRLCTEQWLGPASLAMATAVQPYLVWLTYTAESSALAAAQALASAAAFETAFAMTVPPAEVAANRAMLAALTTRNIFGQNVVAIAATEARYGEMWAQDAAAMYEYAASSAAAGRLDPLTSPSEVTTPGGIANQARAVGEVAASGSAQQVSLGSLISNGPNAVQSLASPATSTAAAASGMDMIYALDGLLGTPLLHNAIGHTGGGAGADHMFAMATSNMGDTDDAGTASGATHGAAAAPSKHSVTPAGGRSILVGLGNASSVGRLSVPASWSTAAPAMIADTGLTGTGGTGWAVPEEDGPIEAMSVAPGMFVSADGVGAGAGPRYGVKPIVMPKQGLF